MKILLGSVLLLVASVAAACDVTIGPRGGLSAVNDPRYKEICLLPGSYGVVWLRSAGEQSSPRVLRPASIGNHPVRLSAGSQVVLAGLRIGAHTTPASWWIVRDLVIRDATAVRVEANSSFVELRRLLVEEGRDRSLVNFYSGMFNALRESVLRRTIMEPGRDRHCVLMFGGTNTTISDNEIYDCAGDAVHIGAKAGLGAVISGNDIYMSPDRYTDCDGELDPDGDCACGENALDFKGPRVGGVIVQRNRLWGFQKTDSDCGGSGSQGYAVVLGPGSNLVRDIRLVDNVLRDNARSVNLGRTEGVEVLRNVLELEPKIGAGSTGYRVACNLVNGELPDGQWTECQ